MEEWEQGQAAICQEQGNLREELTTKMDRIEAFLETLLTRQTQATQTVQLIPTSQQQEQVTVISEIATATTDVLVSATRVSTTYQRPSGYPWGMPPNFIHEEYIPSSIVATSVGPIAQTTRQYPGGTSANANSEGFISPLDNRVPLMINTPAVIHTRPQGEEQVYHAAIPYEGRETQDKMEEFRS